MQMHKVYTANNKRTRYTCPCARNSVTALTETTSAIIYLVVGKVSRNLLVVPLLSPLPFPPSPPIPRLPTSLRQQVAVSLDTGWGMHRGAWITGGRRKTAGECCSTAIKQTRYHDETEPSVVEICRLAHWCHFESALA